MNATEIEEKLRHLAEHAGIEIAPPHRVGVIRNLEILLGQAALLSEVQVDARIEPAPVFRA